MPIANVPATTAPTAWKNKANEIIDALNLAVADIDAIEDGYTATGEQVAPDFKATGKTGATTSPGILAGGTNTGAAPTTGAHVVGELVIGHDGTLYICTVAGTPGTWVEATGGGGGGTIGPETDIEGPSAVPAMIVATDTDCFIGQGDDPADIEGFLVPYILVNASGVQIQGDGDGDTQVTVATDSVEIKGSDGLGTFSRINVGPTTVSMFGASGIDGTDTVADATGAGDVVARLNEALAVLRDLGVLTP